MNYLLALICWVAASYVLAATWRRFEAEQARNERRLRELHDSYVKQVQRNRRLQGW